MARLPWIGGIRVLRDVLERLEDAEVDGRLHLLIAPADAVGADVDRDRDLAGLGLDGRGDPLVDEQRRVDPAREVPQVLQRLSRLHLDLGQDLAGLRGVALDRLVEIAETERVDTIVVGNRGVHGLRWRVRESVPNLVLRHAPCSVLIVDTRAAQ